MRTIAQKVKHLTVDCDAYSLYCGYGVQRGGFRVPFPAGCQLKEKRNQKGRVTHAVYQYADGSVLTFRYDETHGSRLEAGGPHP